MSPYSAAGDTNQTDGGSTQLSPTMAVSAAHVMPSFKMIGILIFTVKDLRISIFLVGGLAKDTPIF